LPNANRFGDLRRSTLSWCRRTRISASNAARDLNSRIKAHQINLQRSLIGSEYQPIRSRSQRFWVCGRDSDRPELAKLLRRLDRGDVLVVTRLDRLARSTRDLLNILDVIAQAGAGFKSLGDAWADTTTPHGRLMLMVLGGLAEFERELILARTSDGRTRAKVRGVKFGRPQSLTPHQRQEAIERLAKGEAQADIARSYAVSQSTISRLAAPGPFEVSAAVAA
jgi:DNA invertase Pin-like site-specific DNA recombinase